MLSIIPLKVWLIAAAAVAIVVGGLWIHHTVYQQGFDAATAQYKAASALAVLTANKAAAAEAARVAAINTQTVNDYEAQLKVAAARADSLDGLVRAYASKLRSYPLPGTPATASGSAPATPIDSSTGRIADAAAAADAACRSDAAQLAALQEWVGKTLH
jgi:hypothetical protein